jgi:hypothetical protein
VRHPLARARETLDGLEQLFGLDGGVLLVARGEGAGDAVAHVVIENLDRDRSSAVLTAAIWVRMSMQ